MHSQSKAHDVENSNVKKFFDEVTMVASTSARCAGIRFRTRQLRGAVLKIRAVEDAGKKLFVKAWDD